MTEASVFIEKEIGERLVEVSRLLLGGEPATATLTRVTALACRSIPRCDASSVMLVEGTAIDTAVSTSDSIKPIDEIQVRVDNGPGLRAIRDGRPHRYAAGDGDVPALTEALRAAGYEAMASFPLTHDDGAIGALELFSEAPDAFDDDALSIGALFAEQAAVALHHARLYAASVTLTEQLQEALTSRAVIDQAKGVLMERLACDADTAFAALREASQRLNRKVRDLALDLVANAGRSKR